MAIPEKFHKKHLKLFHKYLSYAGINRCYYSIRDYIEMPYLKENLTILVNECDTCQK